MTFRVLQLVVAAVMALSTAKATSLSLSTDDMIGLLRQWKLDHVFEADFKAKGFSGETLIGGTQEDFDEVFAHVDVLHRRALFNRIQSLGEQHSRRLDEVNWDEYIGVRVHQDKAFVQLGANGDITLYRTEDGNLQIIAPSVNFEAGSFSINGNLIAGGTDGTSLMDRVAQLEASGPEPCENNGIVSVMAFNS